ncbi:unnamed protein product, partial [Brassica oleracea]
QAGSRTIDLELTTLSSTNHVELTPSDAGFQDRYIVQEIIKELTSSHVKLNTLYGKQWRNIAHHAVSSYAVTALQRLQKPSNLVVSM